MQRRLEVLSIFLIICLVSSSLTQAITVEAVHIPPTPAISKIHTSNTTLQAMNYSTPITIKGLGNVTVTASNYSKTIYINVTSSNGKNGINGKNGTNGINGINGTNGNCISIFSCATYDTMQNIGKGTGNSSGVFAKNSTKTNFQFYNVTSLRPDLIRIKHNTTDINFDSTFKAPNKNCGATNFLQTWINTTGFGCAAGNLGTITTGVNVGKGGYGPFRDTSGGTMNFKNLTSTTKLLTISQNLTDTMINSIFKLNSVTCGLNLFLNVLSNSTISTCSLPLNTAQLTNQFTLGNLGIPIALSRTNSTNTPVRSLVCYDGIDCYKNNTSILVQSLTTNTPVLSHNTNNFTDTGNSGTSTSLTLSNYETVNGNNRLLLVEVGYSHIASVTNVTYNRLQLQKITSNNDGTRYEDMWYLKNPPIGTFNIVANQTSSSEMIIIASSWYGVNQTSSIGVTGTATGSGNKPSITFTTTKQNSVLIDFITTNTLVDTPTSPQQYISYDQVPSLITSQSSYKKTDGIKSYTMSSQFNDGAWTDIAIELLPINPVNFTDTNTSQLTPADHATGSTSLVGPRLNSTANTVKTVNPGTCINISGNTTNSIISDTCSSSGLTQVNGQTGPILNINRGNMVNASSIINGSNTISYQLKKNIFLTNATNQTVTKPAMFNQLILNGTLQGKNNRILNIGQINMTRFCITTNDILVCGLNAGTTNPIISITPMHSTQTTTLTIGPNSTTGSNNQTSIQVLTTNSISSIGSKYLEIKGGASLKNFTINTQSASSGNPYGISVQVNGTNVLRFSPTGTIQMYPQNGYVVINGTNPPPLWVVERNNAIGQLSSVIALIHQSTQTCGVGCGPATDWDVKYPNSNGLLPIGGLAFACIVSDCSQGVFEINGGKTNGGKIRFGIYDNGTVQILNGQMIELDAYRGTQNGFNIGSFSKNFIQYLNNTGIKLVSGGITMVTFNGTNQIIDFFGNKNIHGNSTEIIRANAFSLTFGTQTQGVGNGTALVPNLKGTVDYVAMWGVKNNFTKVFTGYNKTTTKGMGFPTIVNETNNGQSPIIAIGLTANSTGTKGGTYFTPTNSKSLFDITGFLRVTAVTGGTVYLRVDFTDDAGTARVERIPMDLNTGIIFTETAVGFYPGTTIMISSNANKITCRAIATGTITYDMSCQIRQVG